MYVLVAGFQVVWLTVFNQDNIEFVWNTELTDM